ncbi:unnamed protein product [Toxocara canis]|uniref:DUF659 domain-containing protein n=1 Tax=Toxocara canis TaxID=6265 RepID=A0A183VDS0_TOXCA|nr:unnamed protein product [Toxocara canis]
MGFKTFPRRRPLLGAQHPGGPVLRSHYPVGPRITPRYPDMAPRYPGVIPPPCAGVPSMASHRPGRPLLGPPCSRPMPLRPTINQDVGSKAAASTDLVAFGYWKERPACFWLPDFESGCRHLFGCFPLSSATTRIRLMKPRSESDKLVVRSGEEPVTPLAHMEYSEQLKRKTDNAVELINAVLRQMAPAGVKNARDMTASDILQPIRYSSKTSACYNKCEFTVGRNPEGKITVGFVGKRPSAANTFIVSVETYTHISEHMKRVVNAFQKFVVESGEEVGFEESMILPSSFAYGALMVHTFELMHSVFPFNELERTGVWKSLMVRECSGDVLIMASILAMKNSEREEELKKSFAERFFRSSNLSDKENRFRITSIYWERIADAGENSIREHIGGTPYIYETINGTRFRILPETYFPTNSHAAAVFFSTIAEKAGIVDAIGRSRKQTMNGSPNANVVSMEEVMLEDEKGGDSKRADEIEDEKMDAGSIESSSEAALIAEDEGSGTTEDSESTREQMMEDKESNAAKKRKIDAESIVSVAKFFFILSVNLVV